MSKQPNIYEPEALAYCEVTDLNKPEAGEAERRMVVHSIAISLKRIADALETIAEAKDEERHNARR